MAHVAIESVHAPEIRVQTDGALVLLANPNKFGKFLGLLSVHS
jgi:hypothetical protein